jgi:spermidine synthase
MEPAPRALNFPDGMRYLTQGTFAAAQVFPPDMGKLEVEANTMQTHALMRYYLDGWAEWFR